MDSYLLCLLFALPSAGFVGRDINLDMGQLMPGMFVGSSDKYRMGLLVELAFSCLKQVAKFYGLW